MTALEWQMAEKPIDPNFEGSTSEMLGLQRELCPVCKAHLSNGICLNACHRGDEGSKRFSNFMKSVMPAVLILFCAIAAHAQLKRQTPDGEICRDSPTAEWRACAWYERSYLWTREQQEAMLRQLIIDKGQLTMENQRQPQVIDDTARVAAMTEADPYDGWPSTMDLQRELGISGSRIRNFANEAGWAVHWTTRGGAVVRVFSPGEVEQLQRRNTRRGPRRPR